MDEFLSQDELDTIRKVKEAGGTALDAKRAVLALSQGRTSPLVAPKTPSPTSAGFSATETVGDIAETVTGMARQWGEAGTNIVNRWDEDTTSVAEKVVGTGADVFRGIGRTFGEVYIGAGKLALSQESEQAVADTFTNMANSIANNQTVQNLYNDYQTMNPEQKAQLDNVLGYLEGATEILPAQWLTRTLKASINAVKATPRAVATAGQVAKSAIAPTTTKVAETGVGQIAKEIAERPGRLVEKALGKIDDAAKRAEQIKTSSPAVGTAIKNGVSEQTIDLVVQMDEPTKRAADEMLFIAESGKRGERVTSVPGKFASEQYALIDNQRKAVGKQIGDAVANLPDATVDMRPAYAEVDDLLMQNGIKVQPSGRIDFSGSPLAPEARKAVEQAYKLLHEAGDVVDARTVHAKDQLFSNLNRELRAAGTPPVLVNVNGQTQNLFTLMRDVYRSPLDNISDGQISQLNAEYAKYRNFVDAMDDTIFKMSKGGVDVNPAEQAAINLRRIDTDAMSQPSYLATANQMDLLARELGYTGASPVDLVYFSNDIKPLFGTPTASAPGGFFGSVRGAVESVLRAGAPDSADQVKALRAILNETPSTQSVTPPTKAPSPQTKSPGVSSTNTTTKTGIVDKVKGAVKQFGEDMKNEDGFMRVPFTGGGSALKTSATERALLSDVTLSISKNKRIAPETLVKLDTWAKKNGVKLPKDNKALGRMLRDILTSTA